MKNIMELIYNEPPGDWRSDTHMPDSDFVKLARIKSANLDMFMDSLTQEQKDLYDTISQADVRIEEMIHYDKFCHAFHLGAQLMGELIRGQEELLGGKGQAR